MEPVKLLWGLALMAAAAFTDARERRVPNRLILLGLAGRGVLYAAELLTEPEGFGARLLGELAQAGAAAAALALLAVASRGALGFGDVKLLGVACLCCGLRRAPLLPKTGPFPCPCGKKQKRRNVPPFRSVLDPFVQLFEKLEFLKRQ